jgi:hypothetical protein
MSTSVIADRTRPAGPSRTRRCSWSSGRPAPSAFPSGAAWTRTKDQRIMRSGLRREAAGIRAFCVRLPRADWAA